MVFRCAKLIPRYTRYEDYPIFLIKYAEIFIVFIDLSSLVFSDILVIRFFGNISENLIIWYTQTVYFSQDYSPGPLRICVNPKYKQW